MPAATEAKRDIHLVAIDETEYWSMDEYSEYIERIESVFCYDASVGVHLAEFTRSYELWLIEQRAILKEDTPEEIADKINEIVENSTDWAHDAVDYMHTSQVEALVQKIKESGEEGRYKHIGPDDPETDMEDIAQSFRENSAI